MKEVLFFSHNHNKYKEIKKIFTHSNIKIHNLNLFKKIKEPKETGNSFAINAKIKSYTGYKLFNLPCFADDSGICIDALGGRPGVKSKRFLNQFSNHEDAFNFIIKKVKNKKNANASFVTTICLTLKESHHIIFTGKINGRISLEPMGENGFGYDPIFIPENCIRTFAEMSSLKKNKISHRKIAVTKLKSFLF